MQSFKNCRVLTHTLVGSQGCIPVELPGRSRFAKWHLEIVKVVGSLVGLTLICKHTQDQEEVQRERALMDMPPFQVGLNLILVSPIGCSLVHLFIVSPSSSTV